MFVSRCFFRKELEEIWNKCYFGEAQRREFTPAFDGIILPLLRVKNCASSEGINYGILTGPSQMTSTNLGRSASRRVLDYYLSSCT